MLRDQHVVRVPAPAQLPPHALAAAVWSALCFGLLAAVNFVVVLDMLVYPEIDFRPVRLWLSLVAVVVLLFGFIWDEDS